MDINKELELFQNLDLSREQIDAILNRKITDDEFTGYINYKEINKRKKLFTSIAKQASEKANLQREAKNEHKKIFVPLAKRAAKIAERRMLKQKNNSVECVNLSKLFKSNVKNSYEIEKINEYYNDKFKSKSTVWKIVGSVELYKIHEALMKLVEKILGNQPENVRLQIRLDTLYSDKRKQTKFLTKDDMIEKLYTWVDMFEEYDDMHIDDVELTLLAIEIPSGGKGDRVNQVLTLAGKHCVIQIKNNKDAL